MFARRWPKAYWWTGRHNFGDLLTPLLIEHFADVQLEWAPVEDAQLVCVGSVLGHLSHEFSGIVAGSGKLHDRPVSIPRATVLGVRGPLTARDFRGEIVIGDPGLLADELVEVEKTYNLGLVPHWSDRKLEKRPEFLKYNPRIIRPNEDPLHVIAEIGRCRKIVSSSLHGIILADAFGIPRRIEMCDIFTREGGDFKFRDHNAAVGVPHTIGLTQEAARFRVQDRQHSLYDMLVDVGRRLSGEREELWL